MHPHPARKRLFLPWISLLVCLLIAAPAAAQTACPPPPCQPGAACTTVPDCVIRVPGVFTNPDWLKIDHHRVNVEIADQIATTLVDMEFVNEGDGLAEGTFVFPIPLGASVDELIMYINGTPIEARILEADEARGIYDEIVRQYRDPALLEYVGQQAVQANVFPIPPGETRRITITYSQVLEADNGLIRYTYPLAVTELTSRRPVDEMSIRVSVDGQDTLSTIYSPTHDMAINRDEANTGFVAGYEETFFVPSDDFVLYYGLESGAISANLLSYRESADGEGFFMLLVQPPIRLEAEQVIPRDIIVVLDQSGSMDGAKWDQARQAATYVLDNLNERDRFNVILFSTGWRMYASELMPASEADDAAAWVNSQYAEGGTDINGALTTALDMVQERPTTILFLTDGLPTEGETDIDDILENVDAAAPDNARIFTFGVGDDVDTFLLDSLVRDFRGAGSYVRPTERVDEEVASLYNKISAPVLTDLTLEIDGVTVDQVYPAVPLPDLFAGTQLTVVGRYRDGADDVTVTLSGQVNGETQTFVYDGQDFRTRAGGDSFIPRLWATRRIGDLLNTIRLNGENPEIVESIISLSLRYGIITPYTSFLIEEDDILSQTAREQAASELGRVAGDLAASASGAGAVDAADSFAQMQSAQSAPSALQNAAPSPAATMMPFGTATAPLMLEAADPNATGGIGGAAPGSVVPAAPPLEAQENPLQTIGDKTFILQGAVWTDTTFQPDTMQTVKVVFLSDDYFALLDQVPALGEYLAIGEQVIVVWDGTAYEITTG
ncbi:MAG: VIT domain-containing protein [bacterium]|nr:VIT domain-containing protein [bacterium]